MWRCKGDYQHDDYLNNDIVAMAVNFYKHTLRWTTSRKQYDDEILFLIGKPYTYYVRRMNELKADIRRYLKAEYHSPADFTRCCIALTNLVNDFKDTDENKYKKKRETNGKQG